MELINILVDSLVSQAEYFIQEFNEFLPFGTVISNTFECRPISIIKDKIGIKELVKEYQNNLFKSVKVDKEFIAAGYCIDTKIILNEKKIDAIQLNIISDPSDGWIQFYLPYIIRDNFIEFKEYVVLS